MTLEILKNLKLEEVNSVYSGKDGRCCCGCAGKHWSSSFRKNRANHQKVDDKQVRRVLKILQKAEEKDVEVGFNNFSTVIGTRIYIVYPLATN